MFEFDQYQAARHDPGVDSAVRLRPPLEPVPKPPVTAAADVAAISFMHWGEHCIECADPHCYATCALYRPRPDGRCRRFTHGIYRNRAFPSLRGYGAEIAFERWGKLEAEGNAFMEPVSAVVRRERRIELTRPLLRALGEAAFHLTRRNRWRHWPPHPRKLARRLHRHRDAERGPAGFLPDCFLPDCFLPDCFLMEVYNPQDRAVTVQVTIRAIGEPDQPAAALPVPFLAKLDLAPGYSRHRLDRAGFGAILATRRRFKVTVTPEGDSTPTLVFLTLDFVTERTSGELHATEPGATERDVAEVSGPPPAAPLAAAAHGRGIKCVVFDLDETLWHGVLVEGGDVIIKAEMVRLLKALDRRGILLSVASKNDHREAWRRLEQFGLADYVIHPQIGWAPKSEGIRTIADALNIGLDTFVFVDDSSFELAEVERALPMVACIRADAAADLLADPRVAGSGSADARNRRTYYRQAMVRSREQAQWRQDYLGFLRSCGIRLTARRYREVDFQRVSELVQRTNQLNFSGCAYGEKELADRLRDEHVEKYVLECQDRYGSYGTIGFALVVDGGGYAVGGRADRPAQDIRVEDLMLSCRVQGRAIEPAFFRFLITRDGGPRPERLWVRFRPRERNGPALRVLEDLGFRPDETGQGVVVEAMRCDAWVDAVEVVGEPRVERQASAPAPGAAAARHRR